MTKQNEPREDAIHLAAQCWCDVNTGHIEMNPVLAMAFAKRLEIKMQEIDSLKQQAEELKRFIIKWLEFEESCIKKDDPYVSLPIPKLMNEANKLIGRDG